MENHAPVEHCCTIFASFVLVSHLDYSILREAHFLITGPNLSIHCCAFGTHIPCLPDDESDLILLIFLGLFNLLERIFSGFFLIENVHEQLDYTLSLLLVRMCQWAILNFALRHL